LSLKTTGHRAQVQFFWVEFLHGDIR